MPKVRSFPPIVSKKSEILILGTMPGVRSLERKQYYGHPQNRFWKFMFEITGVPPTDNYFKRRRLLLNGRMALWDVLKHCERQGSLDENIQNPCANDFRRFFKKYPQIRAVIFNGGNAEKFYKKHVRDDFGKIQ